MQAMFEEEESMKLSDALLLLGFELEARPTLDAARDRYHALALRHHPDRGGAAEEFARLGDAWEVVKAELAKPQTCGKCFGKGRVPEQHGFHTVWNRCWICNGVGRT